MALYGTLFAAAHVPSCSQNPAAKEDSADATNQRRNRLAYRGWLTAFDLYWDCFPLDPKERVGRSIQRFVLVRLRRSLAFWWSLCVRPCSILLRGIFFIF